MLLSCYHQYHVGGVMVRTQIQLTEEQARKVKKIAASRGVAMAEVIRNAVEGVIESNSGTMSEVRRTRAIEILGKFRSGKKDVSKRHDAYLAETWSK
jgi:Ribbon-helix-helix protein, copG family